MVDLSCRAFQLVTVTATTLILAGNAENQPIPKPGPCPCPPQKAELLLARPSAVSKGHPASSEQPG